MEDKAYTICRFCGDVWFYDLPEESAVEQANADGWRRFDKGTACPECTACFIKDGHVPNPST